MEWDSSKAVKHVRTIRVLDYPELYQEEDIAYFKALDKCSVKNTVWLRELADRLDAYAEHVYAVINRHPALLQVLVWSLQYRKEEQKAPGMYDLDMTPLTANEVLMLILYPFCNRMFGRWEVLFAMDGDMGKLMEIYRDKCRAKPDGESGAE